MGTDTNAILYAFGSTVFTYLLTALGAAVVFMFDNHDNQDKMEVIMAAAVGLMLAAVMELVTEGNKEAEDHLKPGLRWVPLVVGTAVAVLCLWSFDKLFECMESHTALGGESGGTELAVSRRDPMARSGRYSDDDDGPEEDLVEEDREGAGVGAGARAGGVGLGPGGKEKEVDTDRLVIDGSSGAGAATSTGDLEVVLTVGDDDTASTRGSESKDVITPSVFSFAGRPTPMSGYDSTGSATSPTSPTSEVALRRASRQEVTGAQGAVMVTPDWQEVRKARLLVFALAVQHIPEALACGVAFAGAADPNNETTMGVAVSLTLAIGLQDIPEGAAASLVLYRLGMSKKKAFFYGQATGLVQPVAGLIGAFAVLFVRAILPYALGFAGSAMMFVILKDMIPDVMKREDQRMRTALIVMLAYALMVIASALLDAIDL